MKLLNTFFVAFMMAGAGNAVAASSVDLAVKGLITPSACTPALSNNGVIEHGKISARDLKPTSPNYIGINTLNLEVNCDAAILFALRTIDNRAGSSNVSRSYGLGLINDNQKLGNFWMTLENPVADGVAVKSLTSVDGINWSAAGAWFWDVGLWAAFAAKDAPTQPTAIRFLTANLRVRTYIAPANDLDLSNEVPIDGSATLEVKYL
ncbi:DUF1120 domain-containing protein [Pseudomonas trivialis]|uniref:Protein GltF n=1 Tax=Pseudomonas trivialis TaxID=200450 RepID=A0A0R2ZN98_9PSED|nr:DUF1120 domain-containing protein [Pseudomonas trivialis]KRP62255.1 hypothetical protein TU79_03730 [Pseudomonas trivialis]SDS39617.1 Protein of unknown function [Pseudomonas trivialis]